MPYFRVSIKGALPGGEVWSVNPQFGIFDEVGPVEWDPVAADAILAKFLLVPIGTAIKAVMSTSTSINSYRLELRGDAGELLGVAEKAFGSPVSGSGSPSKVYQTSVVASLRTDAPGASGRGRLYWPAQGANIATSTLRLQNTQAIPFVEEISELLHGLQDAIRTTGTWFPTTNVALMVRSVKTGAENPVVRIQVGDVLDTQRRRRDKLAESYYAYVYPPV